VIARLALPSAFGGLSVGETLVLAGALPFSLTWFYASFVALAVDRYEAYVLPPAVQSASAMVLVVALATAADLPGAVVALAASHVIAAAGTLLWTRRGLPERPGAAPAAGRLRAALAFGAKGYAANALQFLNYRLDLFILSAVTTTAEVGRYSVAIAVTSVLWLAPQALSEVLFPRVAALSAGGAPADRDMRAFVEVKSLRHTVALVLLVGAAIAGALLLLVVPVYGEGFREAIDLGLILLPGVALLGVGGVLSAAIVGRGHPVYGLYVTLIVTPLTLVAYAVLVPAMDAQGAALAKTLSVAANFALVVLFFRRVTGGGRPADFLPTRSELADYRALPRAIRDWAAGLRP
jgi:O-antigen/teichoic acid export membrane protein